MAKKKVPPDHDPRWTSEVRPAPGDLRIVQAFLNTAAPRQGPELTSPRALAEFLELWGPVAGAQQAVGDVKAFGTDLWGVPPVHRQPPEAT